MVFNEKKDILSGKAKQHEANANKKNAEKIQSHSIVQPIWDVLGLGERDEMKAKEKAEGKNRYILKSTNRFYFFAVKSAIEYLNKETGKKWSVEEETKDKKGVYLISSEYKSEDEAQSDAKKVKKNIPAVKEKLFKGFGVEVKEV